MISALSAPDRIRALAASVQAAGGRAYVAGGGVRDQWLGLPVNDWDLEVYGLAEERLERVIADFGHVKKVGGRFGVYVLHGIELALPQGPGFQVAADIPPIEACRRRDFTINALLWDPLHNVLLDFFGGAADLDARMLRHVDATTFIEDPVRVLRAARLAGQLQCRIDPATARCCRTLAPALDNIPWERINKELTAWFLRSQDLAWTWDALVLTGAQRLFPELMALQGCPQRPDAHPEGDVWVHTGRVLAAAAPLRCGDKGRDLALMLGALLHDIGKPQATQRDARGIWRAFGHEERSVALAEGFLQRWFPAKALQARVLPLVRWHGAPHALYRDKAKGMAYQRLALRVPEPALLLDVAQADASGAGKMDFTDLAVARAHWEGKGLFKSRPQPWVTGDDMQALGIPAGPGLRRWLHLAYVMQLSGRLADRVAVLGRLGRLVERLCGKFP